MQISTHLLLALIFKAAWSHPNPHQLSKRVDPTTNIGWPEDDISQNHKARLVAAFPDIYRLVEEVTIAYPDGTYQSIWNKYFPPNDLKTVYEVLLNILPDPQNAPTVGGPKLQWCVVQGLDLGHSIGGEQDFCTKGNVAYSYPCPTGILPNQPNTLTLIYHCDKAFQYPDRFADMKCNDLGTKVSEKMNFLAAHTFHEILHNDGIGAPVGHIKDVALSDPDNTDPDNTITYYGPYYARKLLTDAPSLCVENADNYVYMALEVFWTKLCLMNFQDPDPPPSVSCQFASDPDLAQGICPDIADTGWCDCGAAGDFQIAQNGTVPCGMQLQPFIGPFVPPTGNCTVQAAATTPKCGPYDAAVKEVQGINLLLDALAGEACCTAQPGCRSVSSNGAAELNLCAPDNNMYCVDCARLANYVAGMISGCQQNGMVGGTQNISEQIGLWMSI